MTQKGHPLLHLTTVFVTGTTTALLQGAPQHLLQPDHRIWERSTTAFVKGSTTVCLNGRPQHYLRSQKRHIFCVVFSVLENLNLVTTRDNYWRSEIWTSGFLSPYW